MELRNGMGVPHHPLPWIHILTYTFRRKAQLLSLWAVLESLSKGQSMGFGIGQTCFQAWFHLPLVCETGQIIDPSQTVFSFVKWIMSTPQDWHNDQME